MQAGARVPGSGPPPPPPGSWRGRESPAAGARLPGALGARRLQSGREQWSRSWCPRGGAGGGGLPSVARGLQTLWPPSPDAAEAPHASCSPGSIALRGPRRRGVPDCSPGTVRPAERPSDRRKVRGLRCFPAVASARGGGRRGRRNALSRVSVLPGRCRPAPGTAGAPPRDAAGPEFGLPLAADRC